MRGKFDSGTLIVKDIRIKLDFFEQWFNQYLFIWTPEKRK